MPSKNFFNYIFYSLGFIASSLFCFRFLLLCIQNEKKGIHNPVSNTFWILSSIGSLIMIIHGCCQIQYPIAILHSLNLVISLRNLNLKSKNPWKISSVVYSLFSLICFITLVFIFQKILFLRSSFWMAAPKITEKYVGNIPCWWHVIGSVGLLIFSSRFLIQWISTEKYHHKSLPISFWIANLIGGILSFVYFIKLLDPINILNYGFSLFPSIRSIFLFLKDKKDKNLETVLQRTNPLIFISSGEPSGDQIGATLIKDLKEISNIRMDFIGLGGDLMIKEGLIPLSNMKNLSIMGIFSIFKKIPHIIYTFLKVRKTILKIIPDIVICIDYPDFHLILEKQLKKKKYPGKIVHYVCPSIWAWRHNRKYKIEKNVDLLLSILSFEKKLFSKESLKVEFVGHPLKETIDNYSLDPIWKERMGISNNANCISIFPGSRQKEILLNLPLQLKSLQFIKERNVHLLISYAHQSFIPLIKKIIAKETLSFPVTLISSHDRYNMMKAASVVLAKCGTITLELALLEVSAVITYGLSCFDYFFARYVFKILLPSYSLPNIISKSQIYPEYIDYHKNLHPKEIASSLINILNTKEAITKKCKLVTNSLEMKGSRKKLASHLILKELESSYIKN